MKKEGSKKLKIAVIISVVSVLIAIISLLFSIYVGMKDVEYKETIKRIQQSSQDLQKNALIFDENYKKIELVQQSIFDKVSNCDKVNKYELDKNLKILTNARDALIKNNYNLVSGYINVINLEKICTEEIKNDKIYLEVAILAIVWGMLIVALMRVLWKK